MIHVTASTEGVRGAYKSMSWSTSSRERAKLGRLDSEPPLLLREWPPETGRERQGGVGGRKETRRGGKQEGERGAEEQGGSQQAERAVRKGEGEAERETGRRIYPFNHL